MRQLRTPFPDTEEVRGRRIAGKWAMFESIGKEAIGLCSCGGGC